jgi:hypothetical protein
MIESRLCHADPQSYWTPSPYIDRIREVKPHHSWILRFPTQVAEDHEPRDFSLATGSVAPVQLKRASSDGMGIVLPGVSQDSHDNLVL